MKKIKVLKQHIKKGLISETLDILFDSDFTDVCNGEVFIISNHTSTEIQDRHKDKVHIINEGRLD